MRSPAAGRTIDGLGRPSGDDVPDGAVRRGAEDEDPDVRRSEDKMRSGYLVTDGGGLDLVGTLGIRYGASDGSRGLLAFDVADLAGVAQIQAVIGGSILALEPIPDDPDSWPDWARRVPKRHVSNGLERFSLISHLEMPANAIIARLEAGQECSAIAAVVDGHGWPNILLEHSADLGERVSWTLEPTTIRDARRELVGADV